MDVDGYYRARGLENLKAMVSVANEGLKSLLLINGGAIVALLTFLGNAKFGGQGAALFGGPLAWFASGVVASLLGHVAAYVTQYVLFNEERLERGEKPVTDEKTGEASKWYVTGAHRRWQILGAACVVVSLGCLGVGACQSITALSMAGPFPQPAAPAVRVECVTGPVSAPVEALPRANKPH